jgi:hypothetical protein
LADLKSKRARKAGKLSAKLNEGVQRGAISPQEANSMSNGSGGYGTRNSGPGYTGQPIPEELGNRVLRSPAQGQETRIPLLIADPTTGVFGVDGLFPVAISKTATTFVINAKSEAVPYAAYVLLGIDVYVAIARGENSSGFPNQDILPSFILDSFLVKGAANVLYNPQPIRFAGETSNVGGDPTRTISSIRQNQEIQPNNYAIATGTFTQKVANAVAYNVLINIAAVVRVTWDPQAGIFPPGRG